MDRREALKKLGASGAVVVAASTITSSPAFAYDRPTVTTRPSLQFASGSGNTVSFNILAGAATCPGSANSTTASVLAQSTALTTVNAVPVAGIFPTEFRLGGNPLPGTATGTSFTLAKFGTFFGSAQNFVNGDSFRAVITITWRCTYSDGTTSDQPGTRTVTATRSGGSWSLVLGA